MKFSAILLLAATVMLTGCRAAARHTTAWVEERMTLTQSTFREPDVVPERLADPMVAESPIAVEDALEAETALAADVALPQRDSRFWDVAATTVRPAGGCAGEMLDVAVARRTEWRRSTKAS